METAQPSVGARRRREWRRQRRASRRQLCACCGRLFIPGRSDAAFCCLACKQLAYRRRRVSGEPAPRRPTGGPWRVFEAAGPPNTGARVDARPGPALGPTRGGKVIDIDALIG